MSTRVIGRGFHGSLPMWKPVQVARVQDGVRAETTLVVLTRVDPGLRDVFHPVRVVMPKGN